MGNPNANGTTDALKSYLANLQPGTQVALADVQEDLSQFNPATIQSTLHRLAQKGLVRHNGERGAASRYITHKKAPRQRTAEPAPVQEEPPAVETAPIEEPATVQGELVPAEPMAYNTMALPSDDKWHVMVTIPDGYEVAADEPRRDGTSTVWIRRTHN